MATRLNDGPIQDIQLMLQSVTDIATRLFINSAMYMDIYRLVSTSKTWKISRNDLALPTTDCGEHYQKWDCYKVQLIRQ